MNDKEYMQAFIDRLGDYHADIFVEIIDATQVSNTDADTIIMTDYDLNAFDSDVTNKFSAQIILLNNNAQLTHNNYLFKYQSFNNIIARIAEQFNALTGDRVRYSGCSKIICVCGDCSDYNYRNVSKSIVSKLKYSKGGEFLLLSTRQLNSYGYIDEFNKGSVSRLIYSIDSSKAITIDEFFRVDEYGVYYLRTGIGLNRISMLEWDELLKLLTSLRKYFNGIVIDIGTSFTPQNIKLINEADSLWWVSDSYTDLILPEIIKEPENKIIYYLDRYRDDIDILIDDQINHQINHGGISA